MLRRFEAPTIIDHCVLTWGEIVVVKRVQPLGLVFYRESAITALLLLLRSEMRYLLSAWRHGKPTVRTLPEILVRLCHPLKTHDPLLAGFADWWVPRIVQFFAHLRKPFTCFRSHSKDALAWVRPTLSVYRMQTHVSLSTTTCSVFNGADSIRM